MKIDLKLSRSFNIEEEIRQAKDTMEEKSKKEVKPGIWFYWTQEIDAPSSSLKNQLWRCPKCKTVYQGEKLVPANSPPSLNADTILTCPTCQISTKLSKAISLHRKPTYMFTKEYFIDEPDKLTLETLTITGGITVDRQKIYTRGKRHRFVFNKKTKRAYLLYGEQGKPLKIYTYTGKKSEWPHVNSYEALLLDAFNKDNPGWSIKSIHLPLDDFFYDYRCVAVVCYQYPQVSLLSSSPLFLPLCNWIMTHKIKVTATNPREIFNQVMSVNLGKSGFRYLFKTYNNSWIISEFFQSIYQKFGQNWREVLDSLSAIYGSNLDEANQRIVLKIVDYILENSPTTSVAAHRTVNILSVPEKRQTFSDIIRMAEVYDLEVPNFSNYNMKELRYLHDHLVETIVTMEGKAGERMKKRYEITIYPQLEKYNYKGREYYIVVPKTLNEVAEEGSAMIHCAGSYLQEIAEGYTSILFLRTPTNERVATIEVLNNCVIQVKGKRNRYPGDKAIRFVKRFCKAKHLIYKGWK